MSVLSLGRITVASAGTPVQATANQASPASRLGAHSILFQRNITTETGRIYIQMGEFPVGTFVNTVGVLAPPSANTLAGFSITIVQAASGFNAADFWVDAENNGEGCIISIIRA